MLAHHIKTILILTGLVTLSPAIAFFFPGQIGEIIHIDVTGDVGISFARHWGLELACIGGLPVTAAFNAAVRVPVLVAAIIGQSGIVYLLVCQSGNPVFAGMSSTIYFDSICVLLYAL